MSHLHALYRKARTGSRRSPLALLLAAAVACIVCSAPASADTLYSNIHASALVFPQKFGIAFALVVLGVVSIFIFGSFERNKP